MNIIKAIGEKLRSVATFIAVTTGKVLNAIANILSLSIKTSVSVTSPEVESPTPKEPVYEEVPTVEVRESKFTVVESTDENPEPKRLRHVRPRTSVITRKPKVVTIKRAPLQPEPMIREEKTPIYPQTPYPVPEDDFVPAPQYF